MSKFLIDTQTGKVRGKYEHPLNFSISGRYITDVPTSFSTIADTDINADLIALKTLSFQVLSGMTSFLNDELLATPNVDQTKSLRFTTGPNKRTSILPGGRVVTNILTIVPAFTAIYLHWYGFLLFSDPGASSVVPSPSRLLYNYDPALVEFQEFNPTTFLVEIRNSTDGATLFTPSPDVKNAFAGGPNLDFRLRFTNSDPTRTFHLSDWILLYQ